MQTANIYNTYLCKQAYNTTTITTTIVLWPLYRTNCIRQHPHAVKDWRILLEKSFTAHMPLQIERD